VNKSQRRPVEQADFRIQTPAPVIPWKPNVVLAPTLGSVTEHAAVTSGEPTLRPEALKARIGATRALLQSLAAAQAVLDASTGSAATLASADGERGRVAAAAEAYRLESMLDRVLVRTFDEVTALMNERGLA
jgi:hypothetical protein